MRAGIIACSVGFAAIFAVAGGCGGDEFSPPAHTDGSPTGGNSGLGGRGGTATGGADASSGAAGTTGGGGSGASGGSGGSGGTTGGSGGAGGATPCVSNAQCIYLNDECNNGICQSGQCVKSPAHEFSPCGASGTCIQSECHGGVCGASHPVDCSALDGPCTQGICDSSLGCIPQNVSDGTPCNDGSFCTLNKICSAGVCTGGAPRVCPQPTQKCQVAVCNESTDSCVNQNAADGTICDDGSPCTISDKCSFGQCVGSTNYSCGPSDGCCPSGCTLAQDVDCTCANLALTAVASSSGGSVDPYGPNKMNDGIGEATCNNYHWITNSTTSISAYIELDWATPVTFGSFYIETPSVNGTSCAQPGRNVASATVQYWNGSSFITLTSFSGYADDVRINFSPITTTKLRLYNVRPGLPTIADAGTATGNSMIHEWHVYAASNCVPPP